jgi:hypothetical protein
MPSPAASLIVRDTLSKFAEHGDGIGGYCLNCRRLFNVSLAVLIFERGHDCSPRRHDIAAAVSWLRLLPYSIA